jgi:hypothetical protein
MHAQTHALCARVHAPDVFALRLQESGSCHVVWRGLLRADAQVGAEALDSGVASGVACGAARRARE